MKKLFATVCLILLYSQTFAYSLLQVETPPPPDVTPFAGTDPGDKSSPINFIVPFLLITMIALTFYIVKKNKVKTV